MKKKQDMNPTNPEIIIIVTEVKPKKRWRQINLSENMIRKQAGWGWRIVRISVRGFKVFGGVIAIFINSWRHNSTDYKVIVQKESDKPIDSHGNIHNII